MKKLFLIGLVMLAGCDDDTVYVDANGQRTQPPEDRSLASLTYSKSATKTLMRTCVDGVVYITYDRGITVALKSDGSPFLCKGAQIL